MKMGNVFVLLVLVIVQMANVLNVKSIIVPNAKRLIHLNVINVFIHQFLVLMDLNANVQMVRLQLQGEDVLHVK